MDTRALTLRLSADAYESLRLEAFEKRVTISSLIREAIDRRPAAVGAQVLDREWVARAIDPAAFEDHEAERRRQFAALQWAARRKYARDAADALIAALTKEDDR